jgi:mycothiol synthase
MSVTAFPVLPDGLLARPLAADDVGAVAALLEAAEAVDDAIAPPTFRGSYRVDLEGRVHPGWRGRGIGRALLGWQLERGAQVHAERHPRSRPTCPSPHTRR